MKMMTCYLDVKNPIKMEEDKKVLTPQQKLFLANYLNPKSETFSNALQSALKAGYAAKMDLTALERQHIFKK